MANQLKWVALACTVACLVSCASTAAGEGAQDDVAAGPNWMPVNTGIVTATAQNVHLTYVAPCGKDSLPVFRGDAAGVFTVGSSRLKNATLRTFIPLQEFCSRKYSDFYLDLSSSGVTVLFYDNVVSSGEPVIPIAVLLADPVASSGSMNTPLASGLWTPDY